MLIFIILKFGLINILFKLLTDKLKCVYVHTHNLIYSMQKDIPKNE